MWAEWWCLPVLLFWGGHVALLFYDTRAASVLVGVGERMEKGRKKKNLCRAEHVLLRWRLPQCSTCKPFHWEVDCWVFKTEKTFRTSLLLPCVFFRAVPSDFRKLSTRSQVGLKNLSTARPHIILQFFSFSFFWFLAFYLSLATHTHPRF